MNKRAYKKIQTIIVLLFVVSFVGAVSIIIWAYHPFNNVNVQSEPDVQIYNAGSVQDVVFPVNVDTNNDMVTDEPPINTEQNILMVGDVDDAGIDSIDEKSVIDMAAQPNKLDEVVLDSSSDNTGDNIDIVEIEPTNQLETEIPIIENTDFDDNNGVNEYEQSANAAQDFFNESDIENNTDINTTQQPRNGGINGNSGDGRSGQPNNGGIGGNNKMRQDAEGRTWSSSDGGNTWVEIRPDGSQADDNKSGIIDWDSFESPKN